MTSTRSVLYRLDSLWRDGRCRRSDVYDETVSFLEKLNPTAIGSNLLASFAMQIHLEISGPPEVNFLEIALVHYKKATELAPQCIETSYSYGTALTAFGRLDDAREEFRRGQKITSPDHPYVHNVMVPDGRSKEEYIEEVQQKIKLQARMVMEEIGCERVRLTIKEMDASSEDFAQHVIAFVKSLITAFPSSVRARILLHEQVRGLERQYLLHGEALWKAIEDCLSLPTDPLSLPQASYKARQYTMMGLLLAGRDECHRALRIHDPQDPRLHDLPLACTAGRHTNDRVLQWKSIIQLQLRQIVLTAQTRFKVMPQEAQAEFLCLRINELELKGHIAHDLHTTNTVIDAIKHYREYGTWSFFFCPCIKAGKRCSLVTGSVSTFIWHLSDDHGLFDRHMLHESHHNKDFQDKLLQKNDDDSMYLTNDEKGRAMLCFASTDVFLNSFLIADRCAIEDLIAPKTIAGARCLDTFIDNLKNSTSDIRKSIFDLIEGLSADYLEFLLPFIASIRWDELTRIHDNICREDALNEQVTVEELGQARENKCREDALDQKVHTDQPDHSMTNYSESKSSAHRISLSQALMYGHDFRNKRDEPVHKISNLPSFDHRDQILAEEAQYDPYADLGHHQAYAAAMKKVLPGNAICTVCFFELKHKQSYNNIVLHMSKRHESCGLKCENCDIRFLTANALGHHMSYSHRLQEEHVSPG